jgi:putative glycosyl hydrolase
MRSTIVPACLLSNFAPPPWRWYNVKIVGPQITWGTMTGFTDPVVWMDAFIAAYQAANGGRSPQIDYLAFHWYDYGLSGQLDRLTKYGKQFWITEFANRLAILSIRATASTPSLRAIRSRIRSTPASNSRRT